MGSWGFGPTSNDAAADWFDEIKLAVEPKITTTLRQYEEHGYGYSIEPYVRAACLLLSTCARNYTFGTIEDIELGIKLLRQIRESEWVNEWGDPDAIRKELDIEINGLEWARDHFHDENIFRVNEGNDGPWNKR